MEIGSIVECVNDSNIFSHNGISVKKGKLYTVIGFCNKPKGEGIYIEECDSPINVLYPTGHINRELPPFLKSRFVETLPPMKIEISLNQYAEF